MHTTTAIVMRAPLARIFDAAADLAGWPAFLPHYRYIRYYEKGPVRNVVKMAARRSGIPIAWTSEEIIDRERTEIRFTHLKAFTKGMHVVWKFRELPEGVHVEIIHDLAFRVRWLAPLADWIIGSLVIDYIATRTLRCMKHHLEAAA
jgi:ribosome-associated toxin RatA of RatAB toxin-antitoxin module